MGNRQFFAQIGVCVLVGVNVAAYYVFWPKEDRSSALNAKGQENLVASLKVEKMAPVPRPPEAPAQVPGPIVPAGVPLPPIPAIPEKDAVTRLLDRIAAEAPVAAPPFNVEILPPIPAPPRPEPPRPLPPLLADPLPAPAPGEIKKAAQDALTATEALAAKMHQGPWLVTREIMGNRTQLIAQLKPQQPARPLAEFKILCDRVETKSTDGALQAVGNVTFAGIGLTGSCQRLSLPIDEVRIVFEGEVRIGYDSSPGILRTDRFEWELAREPADVRPVTFSAPTPLPLTTRDVPR